MSHHSGSGKRDGLRCLKPFCDGSAPADAAAFGAPRLCLPRAASWFGWSLDCVAECLGPSLPYRLKAPGTPGWPCLHWALPAESTPGPGFCLKQRPAAVPARVAISSVIHQKVFLLRFTRRGGGNTTPSSLARPSHDGRSDSVSDGMEMGASADVGDCGAWASTCTTATSARAGLCLVSRGAGASWLRS